MAISVFNEIFRLSKAKAVFNFKKIGYKVISWVVKIQREVLVEN